MAALKDTLGLDLSDTHVPITQPASPIISIPTSNQEPGFSGFTRSPLPLISNTNPDNLRTYYQNNIVPQFRLSNPATPPVQQTLQTIQQVTNKVTNVTNNTVQEFSGVMGSPGYIIFPFPTTNPLILQWGLTPTPTTAGTQGTITFPIPFVANVFGVNMCAEQVVGQHTSVANPMQGTINLTSFQWTIGTGTDTDGLCPAFWWAWGQ